MFDIMLDHLVLVTYLTLFDKKWNQSTEISRILNNALNCCVNEDSIR